MPIGFSYHVQSFRLTHARAIRQWLEHVCRREKGKLDRILIHFCDDETLRSLKRQFMHEDVYTDVLTFVYQKRPLQAEIFISIDRVKENARTLSVPFPHELHRIILHGLLHCLGYHDGQPRARKKMTRTENHWLSRRNWLKK